MNPAETIGRAFLRAHPQQAGEILEDIPVPAAAAFLNRLPAVEAAPVIAGMLSVPAARCLAALPREPAAALLVALPARSALDLLRRMPREAREALVELLPARNRRALRRALKLSGNTVGTLADTQVLAFPGDTTVERAARVLSSHEAAAECHLYVLEDNARLLGAVPVRDLFGAPAGKRLASIARRRIPTLPANATSSGVLNHPGWKRYAALPVVESDGVFVGVLRRAELGDTQATPARGGPGGGLEMVLSLLEAYVTTSQVLLSALGGIRRRRDRS
jgi:magnesium transporter